MILAHSRKSNSSFPNFQEKERRKEIDHKNKLLLGQLLRIEKDFVK